MAYIPSNSTSWLLGALGVGNTSTIGTGLVVGGQGQWPAAISPYPPTPMRRCGSILNPPPGQWIDCELGCRRGIEDFSTCYYTDIHGKTALVIESTDLKGFEKLTDYRLSHYVVAMCQDCARRKGLIW